MKETAKPTAVKKVKKATTKKVESVEAKPVAKKVVKSKKPTLEKIATEKREAIESKKTKPIVHPTNLFRVGSLLSLNHKKPNKKGKMSSTLYKCWKVENGLAYFKEPSESRRGKLIAHQHINNGRVSFPGLGIHKHNMVGYIVNPK